MRARSSALAERFAALGIESVAIGFLHSFTNPAHEQRTRDILAARLPGVTFTLSCEVSPEMREYERFSTACANAYVQPMIGRYLADLDALLRAQGFTCPLFLMLSGGGLTTVETAIRFPVRLVESGPAGGAIFASHIARQCGLDKVLSYDMGGTTAKICLIDDLRAADQPRLRGRAHLSLQEGERPAAAHPGHRDGRDRRRRRLDRAGRPAQADHRRPGQRRRRSGPRLLWPRRHRGRR